MPSLDEDDQTDAIEEASKNGTFDFLGQSWLLLVAAAGSGMALVYLNPIIFGALPVWKTFNDALLVFGLVNFFANWLATKRIGSFIIEKRKPADDKEQSWARYCTACEHMRERRTHHCKICGACVTVRDHHCFFAGCCIGDRNQKYFIVWTFWVAFGCTYSLFILLYYVTFHPEWTGRGLSVIDACILPIMPIRYYFGQCTVYEMVCTTLLHCCGVGMCVAGYLCVVQTFLAANNLTSHEYKRSSQGWLQYKSELRLLRHAFGDRPYWFAELLFPYDLVFHPPQPKKLT